jgi:dethiobiotin synthetase
MPSGRPPVGSPLRVVLVGTGTGVGKTHVACALLAAWSTRTRVVGLKPVETGVASVARGRRGRELSDQERLVAAAETFHVKRLSRPGVPAAKRDGPIGARERTPKGSNRTSLPRRALFSFDEPVSPHLAAREAGTRIDLGSIARWVEVHGAPVTVIETAGGLFSPLGHGTTNFDLLRVLQPDVAILVAPDRLGVLHELTTTFALAAARGTPLIGLVLSAPSDPDASTGRNAAEIRALGIGKPITTFPRAAERASSTLDAAEAVIQWIEAVPTRPRRVE